MAELLHAPQDPDPELWFTPERQQRLEQQLVTAVPLLLQSGLLTNVLGYWVRMELAREMAASAAWSEQEQQQELDRLEDAWRAKRGAASLGLSEPQLRQKLLVAPACLRWARQQWKHRLETLYLERKDQLDRASCRLLRLSDKYLALECYHRIRAGEASFERLALEHGQGAERFQGGLLPLQPLSKLPHGLAPLLIKLKNGELLPPQRFGKGFALVQLECMELAPLDAAAEELLLNQELNAWIQQLVGALKAHLTSSTNPLVAAS